MHTYFCSSRLPETSKYSYVGKAIQLEEHENKTRFPNDIKGESKGEDVYTEWFKHS